MNMVDNLAGVVAHSDASAGIIGSGSDGPGYSWRSGESVERVLFLRCIGAWGASWFGANAGSTDRSRYAPIVI